MAPVGATRLTLSAARAGLAGCHVCGRLSPLDSLERRCLRCAAPLHVRKPHSIQRTWALLIAAAILYIPANVYPIMRVVSLGSVESSTILGGVAHLWEVGMYPLAVVVFTASVFIPVLKLSVLVFLLLSVQCSWRFAAHQRSLLYRYTEAAGRWSMIDVFVVALLAALVNLGSVATIVPGPAALAFAAVVILTMFAALAFDPRLIWDALDE